MVQAQTQPHAATLVILSRGRDGSEQVVLLGTTCIIGRSAACQIVVPDGLVSRVHACIEREAAQYILRDVGSTNGTFVNGKLLHIPHVLHDGDLIGFGHPRPVLRFVDGSSDPAAPQLEGAPPRPRRRR